MCAETCVHIDILCNKLELDQSVIVHAKQEVALFHKANNMCGNRLRYRPIEALAASCILVVCRFQKIGRTEKEVLAVCSCTRRHLAMILRNVNRGIMEICKRRVPIVTTGSVLLYLHLKNRDTNQSHKYIFSGT
jgi:transcription initiation factor TFIIIB Brf1 subunit/transcription initiation factor TFIIB